MIDQAKAGGRQIAESAARLIAATGAHPNHITIAAMLLNAGVAVVIGLGYIQIGGALVLVVALIDTLDGALARITQKTTTFGAFLDSVIDRYSDMLMLFGLLIWYAKIDQIFYMGLTGMVIVGSVMTSYTRARAESMIRKCKVGFMERPERIVLVMIGAFTNRMGAVLWVILILSVVTVLDRIYFTWRTLRSGRVTA